MDTAPQDGIAVQVKTRKFLEDEAKRHVAAEVNSECIFNKKRKPVLTFSGDGGDLSATTPNMSSGSPQLKRPFSISGKSSPLSGSPNPSPQSIRVKDVDEERKTSASFHNASRK